MKRIADIDCLVEKGSSKKAIVVLHGYGASCQDLAPIGNYIDPDQEYHWYFLDAPLSVDLGYGMQGRAWFPIDMIGLQQAIMSGHFASFFKELPEGFDLSTHKVKNFLQTIEDEFDEILLGGFSQGSMISSNVAFSNEGLVSKLFLLSSTFVNETHWRDLLSKGIKLPIFQSHGTADPVLPVSEAQRLRDFLKENDQFHEYYEFQGGHEIPMPILNKLQSFLKG
ncbi:hypothetical protein HBN50_11730 [Halobacteriovorax sp. GB3]|uniref:alpha/beta hydrolase n=1 Tax=Halobacteriovorax sp. GB3 TaxID=2719615 RepID=UPI00235FF910|nr:hypothetical protein [Halobacteriovorax sp. GB3]MDD0853771.1 hypothetical protein [Halobacteriovorax sp. GB3]